MSRKWGFDTSGVGLPHPWVTSLCVAHNVDDVAYEFQEPPIAEDALSRRPYGNGSQGLCPLHPIHNPTAYQSDEDLFSTDPPTSSQRDSIDLRLLRVCRQVYQEANPLLWKTPVFSFTEEGPLREFVNTRTTAQRRQIQKLHLHHYALHRTPAPLFRGWQDLERLPFVRPLTGLKEVQLTLALSLDRSASTVGQDDLDASMMKHTLKPFINLRYHSLRDVTVLIQHSKARDSSFPDFMSDSWRARIADQLKALMLDPNGRELCEEEHARQLEDRNIAAERKLSETRRRFCYHTAAACRALRQQCRNARDAQAVKHGRKVRHYKPVTPCKMRHICCDDYDCSCESNDLDSSDENESHGTSGDDMGMLNLEDILHLRNGLLVLGEHY
ncbi:MAG: hypothetical protein Q9160_004393 [Pyrenula sp. 1 TL-2023]